MPTISMFYGIIIYMYFFDDQMHKLLHIHVEYQDNEASIAIDNGKVIAEKLKRKQLKLVQAWIEIHKEELMVDWSLAKKGQSLFKIEPLK